MHCKFISILILFLKKNIYRCEKSQALEQATQRKTGSTREFDEHVKDFPGAVDDMKGKHTR